MGYYLEAFKRYLELDGLSDRREFWTFTLINLTILIVCDLLDFTILDIFSDLFAVLIFVPSFTVFIRRLHDAGKSGWWVLVPLINLYWASKPSKTDNYRFDPYAEVSDFQKQAQDPVIHQDHDPSGDTIQSCSPSEKQKTALEKHIFPKHIPAVSRGQVSLELVDSSKLGPCVGSGCSAFQDAITSMNDRNDEAAIRSWNQAISDGIDPLRQGYAYANLGELYFRTGNLKLGLRSFLEVLSSDKALYDSAHSAALYLIPLYREIKMTDSLHNLKQLLGRTSTTINTTLSETVKVRIISLARDYIGAHPDQPEPILEKRNRGTRQETLEEATAFWLANNLSGKDEPFLLYSFAAKKDACEALLGTGVVLQAADSGKLVCTETLTFGMYPRTDDKYEAVLHGYDLSSALWNKAKQSFLEHGGVLNNEQQPSQSIPSDTLEPTVEQTGPQVTFLREDRTEAMGKEAIYRVYNAPDAESAKRFLEENPVEKQFFYLVVETAEGNYCRDQMGIYKE